jgi:formylglycine-generating enzyme required for sulfatase activity
MRLSALATFPLMLFLAALAIPSYAQDVKGASAKCAQFGFKENTKDHAACVKQVLQSSGAKNLPKPNSVPNAVQSDSIREDKFWETAISIGNKEAIEAYLKGYPSGKYVGLGNAQLLRLGNQLPISATPKDTQKPIEITLGQVIKDCPDCPEMVLIPSGNFMMGSTEFSDAQPVHQRSLTKFLIGKTKVTQGQWKSIMNSNPSKFVPCGDDCPVEQVSWNDVHQFVDRLNLKTGKKYRLPSESEWEYAARAGSSTRWSFGDDESRLVNYAWYSFNSGGKTRPVAQKLPNAFGLYDMHGNVWEWTQDCWHSNYSGVPKDGSAWTTGCRSNHYVIRGGSINDFPRVLSSDFRFKGDRDLFESSGFRLARDL